jgi:phosphatidylserine/phosphatidylglycerophosphate/cardiolipin synthase-like enzyme
MITRAHNKVIVIDGWETIGGSFNYTKSAATRNRENVTFISSPDIASAFLANWEARRAVSEPFVFTSPQGLQ